MRKFRLHPDSLIILTVIWFLGVGVTVGIIGLLVLTYFGKSAPEGIVTLIATMAGGLAAILANAKGNRAMDERSRADDSTPVVVTNTPENAVPVEKAEAPGE